MSIMHLDFSKLEIQEPNWTHTIKDPNVTYILGLPNHFLIGHILPRLLEGCDPLNQAVSGDVGIVWVLRDLNHEWRWLIGSTSNHAAFHVISFRLKALKGRRRRPWLDQKVFSKFDRYLNFKTKVVIPLSFHIYSLVHPFPTYTTRELTCLCDALKVALYEA